jgi:hypothetical protein
MKKVICYSLWGDKPMYNVGAIKNHILQKKIFPDWISRYYIDDSVPKNIIDTLKLNGAEIIVKKNNITSFLGLFWRYSPLYECTNDDIVIFRDTDGRLTKREKLAVDEWLLSNKTFHVMKDWPGHLHNIMGAMWGINFNTINPNTRENIKKDFDYFFKNIDIDSIKYGFDEAFLSNVLWKYIKEDCISHISFKNLVKLGNEKPFPVLWENNHSFVGNKYDENDKPEFNLNEFVKF